MARFNLDDYVDVQTRINRFWQEHPDGAIITRLVSDPSDAKHAVVAASVWKKKPTSDTDIEDATGLASEEQGGGGANLTSHLENCETSAIGRALANMGYATSLKDRPSREEMDKANRGSERPPASEAASRPAPPIAPGERVPGGASKKQIGYIRKLAQEAGMDDSELHEFMAGETGKASSNDLSSGDASKLIEKLQPLASNARD